MSEWIILIVSLIAILLAANLFCNALENLGEHLGIADGVTGSIFAAVGTALPETIIPIIAFVNSGNIEHHSEIGIGAILGAPFMLSTFSLLIISLFVVAKRGINGKISPDIIGFKRDLHFFFLSYAIAFLAIFVQHTPWHGILNILIVVGLMLNYFIYVLLTVLDSKRGVADGYATKADAILFLWRFGLPQSKLMIPIQLILALFGLVYFAGTFIGGLSSVAVDYGVSPYLLSLIIIPVVTEMPEKINSISWLYKGKDTLALGNISGSMVFQGCVLPMIGIMSAKWDILGLQEVIILATTIMAVLWLYYNVVRNNLRVWVFLVSGAFYIVSILLLLYLAK